MSDREFEEWLVRVNLSMADGLFIAPRLLSDKMEYKLFALPLPKVLINYPRPLLAIDSVVWDVYEAVCMAVYKLVRLGHSRIMYMGDIESQRGFIRRWQAFQEMMGEHGLYPTTVNRSSLETGMQRGSAPSWRLCAPLPLLRELTRISRS